MTYPITNSSDVTTHPEMAITHPGVIQYTGYIKQKCHCKSDVTIIVDDRKVRTKTVLFSKLSV